MLSTILERSDWSKINILMFRKLKLKGAAIVETKLWIKQLVGVEYDLSEAVVGDRESEIDSQL